MEYQTECVCVLCLKAWRINSSHVTAMFSHLSQMKHQPFCSYCIYISKITLLQVEAEKYPLGLYGIWYLPLFLHYYLPYINLVVLWRLLCENHLYNNDIAKIEMSTEENVMWQKTTMNTKKNGK